jgi:hypothetical protein
MRYLVAGTLLAVPTSLSAAPRLPPRAELTSVEAEGKYAVVEGRACEQFTAKFEFQGKKATTYVIELYVEGNGTGERAVLVQTNSVTTSDSQEQPYVAATGTIVAGTLNSGIAGPEPLPNVGKGKGWSFCLVIKEGKTVVANSGFSWVHYPGKPD